MASARSKFRKKRLLIRSKQQGTLEFDKIIGKFAEENLGNLDGELLDEFESLLEQADRDVLAWTASLKPVPIEFESITRVIAEWRNNSSDYAVGRGKAETKKLKPRTF